MEQIKEAYCSFEIAKLLKEKGFDEICYRIYNTQEKELWGTDGIEFQNHQLDEETITAPTHQMAMAWLREVHKLVIVIDAYHADHWEGYIDSFEINIYKYASTIIVPYEIAHHNDYEEATEVALKYSLENLI